MRATSLSLVLLLFLLGGCATSEPEPEPENTAVFDFTDEDTEFRNPDPWEPINRPLFVANDWLDRILIKPTATGYRKVLPRFAQSGIRNFFNNLWDVNDAVNNVAQGKVGDGLSDVGRVLVNSTVGIGGLFDPATTMGLIDHNEDWGQTLAVWGVPSGPFIMIPGRGPSTVRDGLAMFLNGATYPLRYYYPVSHRNTLYGLELLQDRADLVSAEGVIFGDRYIFLRDAYLQRREYLIRDGRIDEDSDPFDDF